MNIGDMVGMSNGRQARVIGMTELFGQRYADVFIEPDGPVRRVPAGDLRVLAEARTAYGGATVTPAALFIARLAAYQLQAKLTQQGVLSAANFRVSPLPHQVLAVDFVLNQIRPRAMIADEVGLGKTIEAAMVYEELKLRHRARRALVIVPAGLTRQWKDEFAQKFGEQFVIYDNTMLSALRQIHGQEANLWTLHDQVITSLDFVKPQRMRADLSPRERERRQQHNSRVFEDIAQAGWDVAIFDEAHKLSKHADGSETARYKVGEALAQAVPTFLLLTATPHQGDAARFLHLLNLVDPYAFNLVDDLQPDRVGTVVWRTRKRAAVDSRGQRLFKHRITDIYPVDRSRAEHAPERQLYEAVSDYVRDNYNKAMGRGDRAFGFLMILFQRMVTSSSSAIQSALAKRLGKLLAVQRALGNGSNGDSEFDEEAAADEDAQALLDDLIETYGVIDERELAGEIAILHQLLDLARQACRVHDAKMVALLDIIDEVCRREGSPHTKFLIYTEFVATQKAICDLLQGLGYRVTFINGSLDLDQRIAARQDFAGEAQFLVSTDAGGEGINLQFCHVVVNYDLPWNPMKVEQRIGRLDRIGQDHNVFVLNLLIQDTVERRVREVLEAKLDLIRRQFGEDKLADVLSTLQDEFHFDRLYMDAVIRRQAEAAELERVAQQIYERAQQVLERDDLLLPQAQAVATRAAEELVVISQERIKAMLAGYLAAHGEELHEYRGRPAVYYFDLPDRDGSKVRYSDVVFDRDRAVADDGLSFLHLNHPAIHQMLGELTGGPAPGLVSLQLRPNVLPAGVSAPPGDGLWTVYRLRMTNYEDVEREELVSVFVDGYGQSHGRLARHLLDLLPDQVETGYAARSEEDLAGLRARARTFAEAQAADLFSQVQLEHAERLAAEREKIERYYRQQERAVASIAIDNIREAKQQELLDRRRADMASLTRRETLVPDLEPVVGALLDTCTLAA